MDPLAHTLVGATLAETGLGKKAPLGAATLILGANAPDLDFFVGLASPDHSLFVRRGLTHGVAAMLVLPLLLAAAMFALGRVLAARRGTEPPRFGPLLGLATIAVLTHPALDWLNTYGVRLLMPFDGRWFYGDALFIVDPWVWLLGASALVLATSRTRLGAGAWIALAAGASALVFGAPVPWGTQLAWCAGVALIVALRLRRTLAAAPVARFAGSALALYAIVMAGLGALAENRAERWVEGRASSPAIDSVALPSPGDPFTREVIVRTRESYHVVRVAWLEAPPVSEPAPPLEAPDVDDPVVRAALARPELRGFANWLRLPHAEVRPRDGVYEVTLRDLRYSRPSRDRDRGFARRDVTIDPANLPPAPSSTSRAGGATR